MQIISDLNLAYRGRCASFGNFCASEVFEDRHPLSSAYRTTFFVPENATACDIARACQQHRRVHAAIRNPQKD